MTHWTPEQRAEALGVAVALGADAAHERTGIPRRTISSWMSGERGARGTAAIIDADPATRQAVTSRLWEAVTVGVDAVLAGLRDPKTRLGDKAQALRIVAEQYHLLTGQATSRSESLNVNVNQPMTWQQRDQLSAWLTAIEGASDDELAAWAADGGLKMLRDSRQDTGEEAPDGLG